MSPGRTLGDGWATATGGDLRERGWDDSPLIAQVDVTGRNGSQNHLFTA